MERPIQPFELPARSYLRMRFSRVGQHIPLSLHYAGNSLFHVISTERRKYYECNSSIRLGHNGGKRSGSTNLVIEQFPTCHLLLSSALTDEAIFLHPSLLVYLIVCNLQLSWDRISRFDNCMQMSSADGNTCYLTPVIDQRESFRLLKFIVLFIRSQMLSFGHRKQ